MKNAKFIFHKESINLPTFHYEVFVVVTNNISKAAARIEGKLTEPQEFYDQAAAMALHNHNKGKSYILLPPKTDIGDITHECWHVIRRIFSYIGAELENEIVAYHLGYLVLHTSNILEGWKKKKK